MLFIGDLDDGPAEGTARFCLVGSDYETALRAEHAQGLRDARACYVPAARRAGGAAARPGARKASVNCVDGRMGEGPRTGARRSDG